MELKKFIKSQRLPLAMIKKKGIPPQVFVQAQQKIMYWFFAFPSKQFGINELSQRLNISKTTTTTIVQQLCQEKFLNVEEIGRLWRISANITHPYMLTRKVPFHLSHIYESGILEAIHKQIPQTKAVILFGSYRKGDDTEQSDIDIAIEVVSDDEPKQIHLGNLEQLGYRTNVPVNVHVFSRNKIPLNLFANIANGIVLEGFLEVRP